MWPLTTLGNVVTDTGQYGLNASALKEGAGVRFIRITDIDASGRLRGAAPAYVDATIPDLGRYILSPGDLLIARSGATAGKSLLFRGLPEPAVFAGYLIRFKTRDDLVLPEYLAHFLQSPVYWAYIRKTARAVAQPNVNACELAALPLPLPSLAEQRQIVDLLSRAENILRMRREAEQKAKEIVPALFTDMFGAAARGGAVALRPSGSDLPEGWRWTLLTSVARLATGHTPSRKVREYWDGGSIPWITLTDIRALDGKMAMSTGQSVTQAGIDNSSAVVLPPGTVCFSRTASVGFVTIMGQEMCTSQDFVNWVCGETLNSTYLMNTLIQSRGNLRALASGSTHKTIYFPTVEQFHVLLPPIELQRKFASTADRIQTLEMQQAVAVEKASETFRSLLWRMFG